MNKKINLLKKEFWLKQIKDKKKNEIKEFFYPIFYFFSESLINATENDKKYFIEMYMYDYFDRGYELFLMNLEKNKKYRFDVYMSYYWSLASDNDNLKMFFKRNVYFDIEKYYKKRKDVWKGIDINKKEIKKFLLFEFELLKNNSVLEKEIFELYFELFDGWNKNKENRKTGEIFNNYFLEKGLKKYKII